MINKKLQSTWRNTSNSISWPVSGKDSVNIEEISSSVSTSLRPFSLPITGVKFPTVTWPESLFNKRYYKIPPNVQKSTQQINNDNHLILAGIKCINNSFGLLTFDLRPRSSTWVNWLCSQGSETRTPTKLDILFQFSSSLFETAKLVHCLTQQISNWKFWLNKIH